MLNRSLLGTVFEYLIGDSLRIQNIININNMAQFHATDKYFDRREMLNLMLVSRYWLKIIYSDILDSDSGIGPSGTGSSGNIDNKHTIK